MDAGDAFLLVNKHLDDHLWVIVSDPAEDSEHVLIVSLTTSAAHKEKVCLVRAGEHPWVRHESCVAYNYAKVVTRKMLFDWKDAGHLQMQEPLSVVLLRRVRAAAAESVDLSLEFADLLEGQGLLNLSD